jgi:hypothetical protein
VVLRRIIGGETAGVVLLLRRHVDRVSGKELAAEIGVSPGRHAGSRLPEAPRHRRGADLLGGDGRRPERPDVGSPKVAIWLEVQAVIP